MKGKASCILLSALEGASPVENERRIQTKIIHALLEHDKWLDIAHQRPQRTVIPNMAIR
jgi:hypothetical protein